MYRYLPAGVLFIAIQLIVAVLSGVKPLFIVAFCAIWWIGFGVQTLMNAIESNHVVIKYIDVHGHGFRNKAALQFRVMFYGPYAYNIFL